MAESQSQRAEGAITYARIVELRAHPVEGRFDAAHLKEVHRRIFQDLPHHQPGEYRTPAPAHVKARRLESTGERYYVHYAPHRWVDERLESVLADMRGGKALRGLDWEAFAKRMARLYGDLDFLHPFKEDNSRTLRTFTTQLASEAGYPLDWTWSGADAQARDRLYKARDKEVIARAFPGLDQARAAITSSRAEYEAWVFVLARYRDSPDLRTLIREATFREEDLVVASEFRQLTSEPGFSGPENAARREAAVRRHPRLRPALVTMRHAELFADQKIDGPNGRAMFLEKVRERLLKELSAGKEIHEPKRELGRELER